MPTNFAALPDKAVIAATAAKLLLEIKALHFNAEKPFIFTSGWASPVYTDCRRIISFPRARAALMDMAVATIIRECGYESIDVIAGGETAGIPFAAWISERMGLPMQYIRKKPKGFGRNAQIEGVVEDGQRVLLVEDLATDGKSKENFVTALRTAGAQVTDTFVIFHYGIFPQSKTNMEKIGVRLHELCTWWDVLKVARENAYFDANTLDEVEKFLHAPVEWSAAHGGKSTMD
ncbi:orotate phosphoribosyltransferase [Azospirillum sp.]|uniref:orotate phosphoribosyltransferase n=1 Tax=Azospirillum sp. TaxID=34012 RepID=UPI002D3179AC|nr:orotate phosphoribosyltransferase [Azospirillum sp.]HYD67289.1 orotate phosphoribosyltransferase [Azospirillum sp.]